jgi:hypothetical protein
MTAAAIAFDAPAEPEIPLLDAFEARCEARALLVAAGELDFHEAVDALYAAAIAQGLVTTLGPDEVQSILADAFWWVHR